jgi:hypothetical protein
VCVQHACMCVEVGRQRGGHSKASGNIMRNARQKWKVCHTVATCLVLSQLRPESSPPPAVVLPLPLSTIKIRLFY